MESVQLTSAVQNFNWSNPSWDLFILAAWVLFSVVYAFSTGRGRVVNILICIYIAQLLVLKAPFLVSKITGPTLLPFQQLASFVAVFLVLFLFLGRYAFKTSADTKHFSTIFYSIIFSFLQIGLLINIILTSMPPHIKSGFSPLIHTIFIKDPSGFIWLLAPLLFLVILGKFVADSHEL
jgi:hypothetical protein